MEPVPPAVEAQVLNHRTAREAPAFCLLMQFLIGMWWNLSAFSFVIFPLSYLNKPFPVSSAYSPVAFTFTVLIFTYKCLPIWKRSFVFGSR